MTTTSLWCCQVWTPLWVGAEPPVTIHPERGFYCAHNLGRGGQCAQDCKPPSESGRVSWLGMTAEAQQCLSPAPLPAPVGSAPSLHVPRAQRHGIHTLLLLPCWSVAAGGWKTTRSRHCSGCESGSPREAPVPALTPARIHTPCPAIPTHHAALQVSTRRGLEASCD